ncbi:MAG: hypothetical protein F4137_00040 [Acidobacteria bacterium]|nr:hypothetical protein [Acidobacteriota bacterium]
MFPPALLSGGGYERLRAMAGRLPIGVIDQQFGFEFALCREAARADFCVFPVRGSALAAHYIREGKAAPAGSAAAALGACLARQAGDPASFLSRKEGAVVLEYDVPDVLPEEPAPPGIFFVPGNPSEGAARGLHDDPAATVAALWAAAGWCADAAELRQVERVCEALSGTSHVGQAGVMPGRQRAVRLVVHRIDAAELPGLLERLRWPGSSAAAMSVVRDTSDLTRPGAVLSLDVTACGISPRLGLELFRPVEWSRIDRAGWLPVIDRLADKAWCLPAKAEGLRAWPRSTRLIGPGGVYRIHRTINHIKVVVAQGRIVAKAYAAMVVRPPRELTAVWQTEE